MAREACLGTPVDAVVVPGPDTAHLDMIAVVESEMDFVFHTGCYSVVPVVYKLPVELDQSTHRCQLPDRPKSIHSCFDS